MEDEVLYEQIYQKLLTATSMYTLHTLVMQVFF